MVSELFGQKINKRELVKDHLIRAYGKEMKMRGLTIEYEKLSDEKINELYKEFHKLDQTEFFYHKPRS
tara:strand:+ start:1050 stop:1253 length:204 start_codon:yes stop_codon:yes gene_type:complete